jgi:hypothetical protein
VIGDSKRQRNLDIGRQGRQWRPRSGQDAGEHKTVEPKNKPDKIGAPD